MTKLVPQEVIANKILLIRGKKVLLDRDLAELYGVETKVLIQAVKRNIKRFPDDFMFQLTKKECINQIHVKQKHPGKKNYAANNSMTIGRYWFNFL